MRAAILFFLLIKSTISLFHFYFFKSQSHKLDTFKTQEYIYLVASFSISLYPSHQIVIFIQQQLKLIISDSDQIIKIHFLIKTVIIFYIYSRTMYLIEEQMNIHYFFINHTRGVVMGIILFTFKEITKGVQRI
ncbi:hypothetical protein BA70_06125 [Bacillus zhangzhouensis]|uniref:Transmembrane protein n=1 Tax=Bacillus zhangzhouensis TaxID=1178540 RepID=A0A081L8T0_9BACI|nr:hypothetical protein BA70_06125 [Bacillus zhangzhouensis]